MLSPSGFSPQSKFEVRECATLGTLFADVYADGVLFARELPRELAERFVKDPLWFGGNPFVDTPKLRTWAMRKRNRTCGRRWSGHRTFPPDDRHQ